MVGCATGEEAYSIAILLREFMDETRQTLKIQIYSTDLDDSVIALARAGIYPPNIAQDIGPERLRHFFVKEETGYPCEEGCPRDGNIRHSKRNQRPILYQARPA